MIFITYSIHIRFIILAPVLEKSGFSLFFIQNTYRNKELYYLHVLQACNLTSFTLVCDFSSDYGDIEVCVYRKLYMLLCVYVKVCLIPMHLSTDL